MITIIDYGLGNLKAFANVYKMLNIDVNFASTINELEKSSKIILPGVGSFDHAMTKLNESGLRECLDDLVLRQKIPVIGICVGMQIMAESSEEGELSGLSWIEGSFKRISSKKINHSQNLPLPHMGWNDIKIIQNSSLTKNFGTYQSFYFLHSYYFTSTNSEIIIATTNYGFDFPCVININNIFGVQCHPEKSHQNGIKLLKNFAELP